MLSIGTRPLASPLKKMKATMPETETYGNRDLLFLAEQHYISCLWSFFWWWVGVGHIVRNVNDYVSVSTHGRWLCETCSINVDDFLYLSVDFCWMYIIQGLISARCISYKNLFLLGAGNDWHSSCAVEERYDGKADSITTNVLISHSFVHVRNVLLKDT